MRPKIVHCIGINFESKLNVEDKLKEYFFHSDIFSSIKKPIASYLKFLNRQTVYVKRYFIFYFTIN